MKKKEMIRKKMKKKNNKFNKFKIYINKFIMKYS